MFTTITHFFGRIISILSNQGEIMPVVPTLVEKEVRNIDIIISKSDRYGNITYGNQVFFNLSGYRWSELLEKPHSIVRHPDMPKVIYKVLWEHIKSDKEVFLFVKNLSKDGSFYWVYANVRVAKNPDGSYRNYISVRKQMSKNAREVIEKLYENLLNIEREKSVKKSKKALEKFLSKYDATIDNFSEVMKSLQGS